MSLLKSGIALGVVLLFAYVGDATNSSPNPAPSAASCCACPCCEDCGPLCDCEDCSCCDLDCECEACDCDSCTVDDCQCANCDCSFVEACGCCGDSPGPQAVKSCCSSGSCTDS